MRVRDKYAGIRNADEKRKKSRFDQFLSYL